jgi:plasmid stabilization system protein ParE
VIVVWAPRARRRLQEIVDFIGADQPPAVQRVLEQLLEAARTLGEHPTLVDEDVCGARASSL